MLKVGNIPKAIILTIFYCRSRPKTHPCLKCGASFTTSSTLRKHERTHNDDRRYACDICGKRFIQKTHLDTHRLRHTGDRPFACDQCDKKFVTSSNLTEHLKSHTGNKRVFACTEPGTF
jgi:KRAB domain-containing zinc finger protein